jgi:hypothetical protein
MGNNKKRDKPMKRLLPLLACTLLSSPVAFAQTAPAAPQAYTPTSLTPEPGVPQTPDGRPDLQGAVWAANFFPVFEASPMATTLVVSEEKAKQMVDTMVKGMANIPDFKIDPEAEDIIGGSDGLPLVRGERRSRLIVIPADGKVPLNAAARAAASKPDAPEGAASNKDNHEQRPASERCLVLGGSPPTHATIAYTRQRFVQTPDHLVIHHENGDEARIIPFATEHAKAAPKSWFGNAIARWEGDTLVIETINQDERVRTRGLFNKFYVGKDAKVIERYTRVSADELLYQFTVEDPSVYTAPWLGEFSLYTADTGMFASPCHEHNHSLTNILLGQRMIDLRTATAQKQ